MSDEPRIYRTKTGRVLTDADIEAFADEAERGYEVKDVARRPGRPRIGSAPATVVPVRLHAELHAAVKAQAEAGDTSVSELVRDALRSYLAFEALSTAELQTKSGRMVTDADIANFAADAVAGYDLDTLHSRRSPGGAQVVPVRMPPELKAAAERRAEAEATSVSEVVREALRARLRGDNTAPIDGGTDSLPPTGGKGEENPGDDGSARRSDVAFSFAPVQPYHVREAANALRVPYVGRPKTGQIRRRGFRKASSLRNSLATAETRLSIRAVLLVIGCVASLITVLAVAILLEPAVLTIVRTISLVVGVIVLYGAIMACLCTGIVILIRRIRLARLGRRHPSGEPTGSKTSAVSWEELPEWLFHDRPWAVARVLLGAPAIRDRTAEFVDVASRRIDWPRLLSSSANWPAEQRLLVLTAYELAFDTASEVERVLSEPVTLNDMVEVADDESATRIHLAMEVRRGTLPPHEALSRLTG